MAHPTRSLSCPHWAVQMMSYLARAQPAGDLRTAQITLTAPFPPSPLRHAVKCLVGVVGRRVSIVSRGSGSQGSRVNGSRGLNGFKGTKNLRVSGFQGIEGIPMLTGLSKVWRFQNPKPSGSKGSRVSGFQSSRVNGSQGLNGFKGTKNLRVSRSRGIEGLLRLTGAL